MTAPGPDAAGPGSAGLGAAAPDRLALLGLRAFGHHGVLASERRDGQEFVVDVELELLTGPAAAADDLALTVDYGVLAQRLHDAVGRDPVDLIETLAQRLADICLAERPVLAVTVRLHKPSAPIPVPFADVVLSIRRERS